MPAQVEKRREFLINITVANMPPPNRTVIKMHKRIIKGPLGFFCDLFVKETSVVESVVVSVLLRD